MPMQKDAAAVSDVRIDIPGDHEIVWRGPRPPVERYVRASVDIPGGSVEVGIGYRDGKPDIDRDTIRKLVHSCYFKSKLADDWRGEIEYLATALTPMLERDIAFVWPGRAWFFEVWSATEALTQVYQPYGVPRSQ